ncbi:MAG TPA: M42 family metallopeptidase [Bacillota bacterium]
MEAASQAFLERLLESISPSGYEAEAARVVQEEASSFADEVRVDVHGNVHVVVNRGAGPRVMLAGHIDEIGLQITHIDREGFLRFATIGGWDPQILQGQRVWIRTARGRVTGVVGKKAIHLLREEARKKVVQVEDMWIDIGARSPEQARELVAVGDCAVIAQGFERLGDDLAVARGMDDRCGAFVVIEAARLAARLGVKAEVHAVATVQEEIGLRGAVTSAFRVEPHVALAVDVTHATDYPGMKEERQRRGEVKLGAGPVVARGPNINPKLFDLILRAGEEAGIPLQIEAEPRGTGTDANAIQLARGGVATGLVSIPNRYMHSPVEIVSLADLEACYTLLAETIRRIDRGMSFVPW